MAIATSLRRINQRLIHQRVHAIQQWMIIRAASPLNHANEDQIIRRIHPEPCSRRTIPEETLYIKFKRFAVPNSLPHRVPRFGFSDRGISQNYLKRPASSKDLKAANKEGAAVFRLLKSSFENTWAFRPGP